MAINPAFTPSAICAGWLPPRLKMSEPTALLRIRAESSSTDPHSLRFVLERDVQVGAAATFADAAAARNAPLAKALFAIAGVEKVDVAGAVVAVLKTADREWAALKGPIALAIRDSMARSDAPLGMAAKAVGQARSDTEIRLAVQEVLDRQANPSIASHGGHVSVTDVRDGVVSIRMSGGCQGCASSAATLRGGVERMIQAAAPEIRDIIDVTDHAAGETPYYSAAPDGPTTARRPLLYRPVPPDAIAREDGQFLISPDYLAPRLGMDAETLRAALRTGEVVSQSESGAGEDAGKTRLVMRSSHRVWAVEIAADGTAHEIPAPRAATTAAVAGSALRDRIRAHLMGLSAADAPLTYGQLARTMGMYMPGSISKVTQALEATMIEDAETGAPFLAALVVSKVGHGGAAKGFHLQARALGRGPAVGEDDNAYHRREFMGAHAMLAVES
jgi:Fe-S cluster biogenesis protein NfuA